MTNAHQKRGSKCGICGAASIYDLCTHHKEAKKRLTEHFGVWRERKGSSWEDYLTIMSESQFAGIWVREAAAFLLAEAKGKEGQNAKTPDRCPA